jgi:uncharacterized protein (TIGR02270 family)
VNRQLAIVENVVNQHSEELANLWNTRQTSLRTGSFAVRHLARFDARISAHQDGCVVAGRSGIDLLVRSMAEPDSGRVFALSLVALEIHDGDITERCFAIAQASPENRAGLVSALGWVASEQLARVGRDLLQAKMSFRRRLGIGACRLHGVHPGSTVLRDALRDGDPLVRAEALRTSGVLGRQEMASIIASSKDDAPGNPFWAAWSAVLLGNRGSALEALADVATKPDPQRKRAFRLALQAMPISGAHAFLQSFARDPRDLRRLIEGSGFVGDSTYIPWLIGHMAHDRYARLAGEAFSVITGTDLALLDLERKPPENFESGPNDDPDDPNVEMDPDDGLPWPDPDRIKDWWTKNSHRFQPGTRYFMGAPVTREHCIDVLRNGYQRQRILAAHYLCLLEPGTPLFNTSAPAWRQQKLLAQMS